MRFYAQKLKLVASKSLLLLLVATPLLATGIAGKLFVNNQAYAATSSTINFQARLMSAAGAIAPDGDYNVEFKIYDTASTGGTAQGVCTGNCKWVETRTSTNKVHVANGYISVQLGSVTGFGAGINWDQQLWITMNIGGTGTPTWDGEMTPRLQLTAVPYAFRAGQLASLAGSNTAVLQFAASFGQNTTITLPDPVSGTATVCYQASSACGFLTGASTDFIQNGTSVQAAANFNIRSAATGSVAAVIQGSNGQTADLLDVQTWNGTTNTTVFGVGANGQITLGGGLNPDITTATASTANGITLQPGVSSGAGVTGAATSVKAGDVAGTGTVTGGTLTLQGGSATAGTTRNGGGVTIDGGTGAAANGSVSIGAVNAPTVNIGSVGSTAKATTIHIADTSTTTGGAIQTVTIGSNSNLAHTTVIQGGNGNTAGSEAIRLVPQTTGGIAIGSTTGTGTITLGQANASNTINIGSADFTTASTQTINIANGLQTTGASTLNVNILSNTGNGTAGNAILRLGNNDRVQQIDIGNVVSDGNRSLNLFTGNTASGVTDTINVGTGNAAGSKVIHIGDGTPSGSGVNTITVGSTALTSTTTVQGGTGSGAVSIQAGASGTISVGTSSLSAINIGYASSTTTLTGTVKLATLGASTTNSATVCRDSSTTTLTSCDSSNTTGKPFLNGGNSFGAAGDLGTNDAQQLNVRTSGTTRLSVGITGGVTVAAGNALTVTSALTTLTGATTGDALVVSNSTSTGNIAVFKDNATTVATIADGGAVLLQNATDSTTAFQVKTSAAGTNTTLLGVDTTGSILNVGAVGAAAVASTVNVATSTGAAQSVNIGGTSGAAANGTSILLQGGNGGGAVQLQALAGGSISIGTNNTGSIIQIGSNTLSSGTQVINIGNNSTSGGTTDITIGTGSGATGGTTSVQAKTALVFSTNGIGRVFMDNTATMYLGGNAASVASPNDYTIQGAGTSTATQAGAAVKIQGGTGNTTGAGGKVTIQGGTGGGSGVKGLIELNGGTYFTTGSYSSGSTATITQSLIDSNSAILATATVGSLTFTVPTPTNGASQAGRVLYIVNAGSNAFTLSFASSNLSLSAGATATLIWSGTAWTGAGADSATLQNDYNNSLGGTTPEIVLDNTRKSIDIQDANGGYVGSNAQLLAVRTGAASGLGNPLLTVTNSGGNSGTPLVGIGVETATRALHVSVNNSTTSGGPFLLENLGSGDASMEYKSTGGSFYTGIDTSDSSKFKITSSVAAGTSATFGRTTIAASTDVGDSNFQNASKFTMGGSAGTMSSISVYINGGSSSNAYSVALYADSGGVPGAVVASSTSQLITPNAWNTTAVTAGLSAGANYWLAFNTNDNTANMRFDNTGTSCFISRTFALGWPPTFGACTGGAGIQNFSIYATYSLNSTTDTFGSNSLFTLGNTGQATFQNFLNSTNAFQVLNATGTTLLNVDTNTPTVNLGVTGATVQASTVNVGTSTGGTQVINIGSATSGTAANGTTVLMQGGNTSSAVSIQALASGTINIGSNNAANTLQVGATALSTGTQSITVGGSTGAGTQNVTVGSSSSAGAGTTTVQAKGAVTITAGAASTWSTTTGNLSIQAGASAGLLSLTGGTATGATTAGAVTMQGGAASATAGSNGGGINIYGAVGTSTGTGGAGGAILLSAGNAGGSGNNTGGNITLNLGGATGTGASGSFFVQNSLGANLLTVDPSNTYNGLNLALNPGAEVAATFATNWTAHTGTGTPTITQDLVAGEFASGTAGVKIAATGANQGVRNNLGAALATGTIYVVSFSVKSSTAISDLTVSYYRNNTPTLDIACSNYSSQAADSTGWKKVSCTFQTSGNAGNATAFLAITQVASATRSIFVDNLSIVAQNNTGTSNVGDLKVGGALSQGLTLLTLDTYAGNPFSGTNSSLAGSMYFDTTSGKIQCYDGTSWGASGAAPNGIVTLTPEYAGAVLNGSGIGTMTSDFCANSGALTVGTLCGTNDARNFYKWTSPQGTAQAYSIYVTYKLPPTFKAFVSGSTSMTGLVDNTTNATLKYAIFKSTGSAITQCSALSTVVGWNGSSAVGSASTWTTGVAGTLSGTTDPSGCSFAAGNNVIFQIQVSANSNASAYAENLNFQYSNQ
ncbi:MAG TPA: hypothetical protein VLF62_02160 [Candidatus Saccharimonadales bacterium]|nr:hypothetical protein [Candidatus Saccharimonadales bacterium]